jgi:hypothetical protein
MSHKLKSFGLGFLISFSQARKPIFTPEEVTPDNPFPILRPQMRGYFSSKVITSINAWLYFRLADWFKRRLSFLYSI